MAGGLEGCVCALIANNGRSRMTLDPPSHPYNAGAEHVGCLTDQAGIACLQEGAEKSRKGVNSFVFARCKSSLARLTLLVLQSFLGGGETTQFSSSLSPRTGLQF